MKPEQSGALALRANGLKGACVNLGALGLAAQVETAERALGKLQQDHLAWAGFESGGITTWELTHVTERVRREAKRLDEALRA